MRKEIKKLIAATMSMALVLGVGNTVNIKAGTESKIKAESFCFEIKSHCAASRNPGSIKRTSHKTDNAWSVVLENQTNLAQAEQVPDFILVR